jgi:hypothetical protein
MSEAICNNCGCPSPEVVAIPGATGAAGADGTNGSNSYTLTTSTILLPAYGSGVALVTGVADSAWMAINQVLFISDGTISASFQVVSKPSPTTVQLRYLGYPLDSATGNTIAVGAVVTPSGQLPLFGSLPAAITDNSGGTGSNTMAAGVGIYTLAFYVNLIDISTSAATILNTYLIGHRFKILALSFALEKAATTAAKAVTITPGIGGVAITGGVLSLTSANCTPIGTIISGTTVTGNNVGTSAQAFLLVTSANTAFVEGSGWIIVRIQNLDSADAFATLSAKVNSLIAAL